MPRTSGLATLALVLITAAGCGAPGQASVVEDPLRVSGSTTVNPIVAEAAEILRAERDMTIMVDTQGGSSGGISGIGQGTIDVGMSSRPISDDDRARWPAADFVSTEVGTDAVALVVSREIAPSVGALSRDEVRAIYEGTVTNWSELGGPDQRIIFFNKEPGRGTWEVFAHWLYGDSRDAPMVSHPEVGGNEEGRTKVASTPGAITQLSSSWAGEGDSIVALDIELADGTVVAAAPGTIRSGLYPMARSLFLITDGPPEGNERTLIGFVLSRRGQDLVRKHGYLGVDSSD